MSITDQHIVLQIAKGIYKAPGDENSAEQDMERVDLLDETGLALTTDGWSPKIAALKGGGVWAESSIATGRRLLSGTDSNVTETMQITLGNPDISQRHAILKRLNRIIQDCRDFWQTEYQIDPVFLIWHSAVGAGEQYALIYNIELDYQLDSFMLGNPWDVTLTIEREPYWRGLPPGMNPKEWYLLEYSGRPRGSGYTVANLKLYQDDDHLWVAQIDNKHEWNPDDYYNPIGKNWVEIPADRIPGDAPALVSVDFHTFGGGQTVTDIYIARSTKPTISTSHGATGLTQGIASMWNAADGYEVSANVNKTVTVADLGVLSNGSKTVYYYVAIPFTTNPGILDFGRDFDTSYSHFDMNLLRGTYAVFLRYAQNGGADGDVDLQLDLYSVQNTANLSASFATFTLSSLAGASATSWVAGYMGTLTIPPGNRAYSGPGGYGLDMYSQDDAGDEHNFILRLTATRNAGSADLGVLDLVLLPIDEGMILIKNEALNYTESASHFLYDNTGYIAHGEPGGKGMLYLDEGGSAGVFAPVDLELRGPGLELKPGVNNRLYFLTINQNGNSFPLEDEYDVRINIIPRWRGIRDT